MPRMFAVQLKDEPAERYENWVNTPVYTHDYSECVGWLGDELPDSGYPCEFASLAGDGNVFCASAAEIVRLRDENARLRSCLSDDAENAMLIMGENKELRRLASRFADYVSQDRCEGCVTKRRCNDISHYHAPTVEQVIHDLTLGKITESQAIERIEALHGC